MVSGLPICSYRLTHKSFVGASRKLVGSTHFVLGLPRLKANFVDQTSKPPIIKPACIKQCTIPLSATGPTKAARICRFDMMVRKDLLICRRLDHIFS